MLMKNLLPILCLWPAIAMAQTTTKQKVLYMNVVRTSGTITSRLEGGEDYLGPVYNPESKRLVINGASRTLSSIKEIRFEIQEEEVEPEQDAIQPIGEDWHDAQAFDLNGRQVNMQHAQRGIYIIGKKKIVKP